jgi:hypothetical protein
MFEVNVTALISISDGAGPAMTMTPTVSVEIPFPEKHYRDERVLAAALRELADKIETGSFMLVGRHVDD